MAPGGPGTPSYFDLARKDCVGTATGTRSKVWYTVAGGVLSAVAMAAGPAAALPALDELARHPALAGSHRVWAVRAEVNRRAGRTAAALADYDRALELVANQAERRYLTEARRQAEET